MKTVKLKWNKFKNDVKQECFKTVVNMKEGNTAAFSKADRLIFIIAATLTIIFLAVTPALAAGDIIQQVQIILSEYYGRLVAISTLVAAFLILLAILWTMLSPSSHSAQTPISWIKKIIICYVAILCIGGIIVLLEKVTNGLGFTPN